VFVGENQVKLPFELAESLQNFGQGAQYIKIKGNGKNALDFNIAYYLGELIEKDPEGYFHIISKYGFNNPINADPAKHHAGLVIGACVPGMAKN
jgi:hypothetical protein